MIKKCCDLNGIAEIWSEAFGDGFEDIEFFYDNIKHGTCYAYYCGDSIASMLYLVECNLRGKKSYYIYAACTLQKYRGRGYMSKLLEYIMQNYSSVCLVPADEGLIDFYSQRGINYRYSLNDITFNECDELVDGYLFEGCALEKPIILCSEK